MCVCVCDVCMCVCVCVCVCVLVLVCGAMENVINAFRDSEQFNLYPMKVLMVSALKGEGIEGLWKTVEEYCQKMKASGAFFLNFD